MNLVKYDTMLPGISEWDLLTKQAGALLQSGLLPQSLRRPEQVIVVILKGRELNIPPMQALEHIHVISGKPSMSAELMLGQILKLHPKTKISYPELNNDRCVIEVIRYGNKPSIFAFTVEDAQRAGLMSNPSWKKYPRAMCRSRAIAEMARSIFPDALAGVSYTPEELGAVVDEDGTVVHVDVEAVSVAEIEQPEPAADITEAETVDVGTVGATDEVACKTLPQRMVGMLDRFAQYGVSRFDVELEIGKKCTDFNDYDYDRAYSFFKRTQKAWEQTAKDKLTAGGSK